MDISNGSNYKNGEWVVDCETASVGFRSGNCTFGFFGYSHCVKSGKVWQTIKETKEAFKDIRIVPTQHVEKLF